MIKALFFAVLVLLCGNYFVQIYFDEYQNENENCI